MAAIENHAAARGMHAIVGAVTAANTASRRFHAALGDVEAGLMPQVGGKFGRYHDLVLMQKLFPGPVGDSTAMG
jgi:phosphinothricin acetyltransferase